MPNKSRWIHCAECGRNKLHWAHGLCDKCCNRSWHKTNSDRARVRWNQWYGANRDERREYERQWGRDNPGSGRERAQRRRALKLNAPVNDLTAEDWQAALAHYNHKCVYCGATEDLTQDHIIPLIRGGPHTISNVAPACRSCNSRKGARTPAEARMYLWQLPLTHSALDI